MSIRGTIGNQVRFIFNASRRIVGFRDPSTDEDVSGLAVPITQADIDSPSTELLELIGVQFRLNVAPYTFYHSDGTALVPLAGGEATYDAAGVEQVGGVLTSPEANAITESETTYPRRAGLVSGGYTGRTITAPATGVTWGTPTDAGGGATNYTASGVHSLGAATGRWLYVSAWSGTGTAGFFQIGSVPDTTHITLSATTVAMGNPTIAWASNDASPHNVAASRMPLLTWTRVANMVGNNGQYAWAARAQVTASTNAKSLRMSANGTQLQVGAFATNQAAAAYATTTFVLGDHNGASNTATYPLAGTQTVTPVTVDFSADVTMLIELAFQTAGETFLFWGHLDECIPFN